MNTSHEITISKLCRETDEILIDVFDNVNMARCKIETESLAQFPISVVKPIVIFTENKGVQ